MIATVYVTKTDIQKGIRLAGDACPVARAVKRRFKTGLVTVSVTDGITLGGQNIYVDAVVEWVKRFDNHGRSKVQPFRFKMIVNKTNTVLRSTTKK